MREIKSPGVDALALSGVHTAEDTSRSHDSRPRVCYIEERTSGVKNQIVGPIERTQGEGEREKEGEDAVRDFVRQPRDSHTSQTGY